MRTRQQDAQFIQLGACNPTAIAHSFITHAQAMREDQDADTNTLCNDPALRLMVHQLAFLMGSFILDNDHSEYIRLMREIEDNQETK